MTELEGKAQVYPMFLQMNRLLHLGDFKAIELQFATCDVRMMERVVMLGMLRITSSAKHRIANWFEFRDKVKEVLLLRHLSVKDVERLMVGML